MGIAHFAPQEQWAYLPACLTCDLSFLPQLAQVKWIDDISKQGRERQKQFLQYFSHLLEQAIRFRMSGEQDNRMAANEQDFALRLNKTADISCQQAIIEEINNAIYYIERNAHAKMLFHALTIRLYHILVNREVAVVT